VSERERPHGVEPASLRAPGILPDGTAGIDAGLTLTKTARAAGDDIELSVQLTRTDRLGVPARATGVTGARVSAALDGVPHVPEIEAAARGAEALLRCGGRGDGPFLLALIGTGTAFAAVREDHVSHLGGAALGGGSFTGIARRLDPALDYPRMLALAEAGDRRRVDTMISDAYPEGIGRIGPDLTAAHMAKEGGSIEDVLAALINLHGESIAQIAGSRARIAQLSRVALAGGFVHNNPWLITSLTGMLTMFGVAVDVVPSPGFAGAIGAALVAARRGAAAQRESGP
jgi:pantothenate kinase